MSGPIPLWQRVLDDLRRAIESTEFAERFPTDRELSERYGVSRHTVREAVRRLTVDDGVVIERRPRLGGVLVAPQRARAIAGLVTSLDALGARLDVVTGAGAARLVTLQVDGEPLLAQRRPPGIPSSTNAWAPEDLAAPPGPAVRAPTETLNAAVADADIAEALHIPLGRPVLELVAEWDGQRTVTYLRTDRMRCVPALTIDATSSSTAPRQPWPPAGGPD